MKNHADNFSGEKKVNLGFKRLANELVPFCLVNSTVLKCYDSFPRYKFAKYLLSFSVFAPQFRTVWPFLSLPPSFPFPSNL